MKTFNEHAEINESLKGGEEAWMFQGDDTSIVVKVANGKIDAKRLAQIELANRGFDKKGKWIGFEKAAKLWKV